MSVATHKSRRLFNFSRVLQSEAIEMAFRNRNPHFFSWTFFFNHEFLFKSESKENHSPDVAREQTDKTGDGKFPLCLPTTPGNVQDLHTITPQTLSDLLQGVYKDTVQSFRIIDCRYPYEYAGGHIKVF